MEKSPRTEPVRATVVSSPSGDANCRRIALINFDGLVVNSEIKVGINQSENPVALFREKLDAAARDPRVCAYVVRINSPGGGVVASDLMFHDLENLRRRTGRPVVAYVMELGTGGGYYMATAADLILAHPNSITGGIVVIFNHYSLEDTMAQYNVISKPIKSGDNIDMGTYRTNLSQEVRDWMQEMAEEFHDKFKDVVVRRRATIDNDESTFDGRKIWLVSPRLPWSCIIVTLTHRAASMPTTASAVACRSSFP